MRDKERRGKEERKKAATTATAGENMKSREQWESHQTDSEQLQNNEMKSNRNRCVHTHLSCAMAVFAIPLSLFSLFLPCFSRICHFIRFSCR